MSPHRRGHDQDWETRLRMRREQVQRIMRPVVAEARSSRIPNGDLDEEIALDEGETDTEAVDTDDDGLLSDSLSPRNPSPPQATSYPRYQLNYRERIRVEASLDLQQKRRLIESRLNPTEQNEIEDSAVQALTGVDSVVDDAIRAGARAILWDAFLNLDGFFDHSPAIFLEDFYPDRDPTIPPRDFINSLEIASSDPTDESSISRSSRDSADLEEAELEGNEHGSSNGLQSHLTDAEIHELLYPPPASPATRHTLPRLRPRRQSGRTPLRPRRSEEVIPFNARAERRSRSSTNASRRSANRARTSSPNRSSSTPTVISSSWTRFHGPPVSALRSTYRSPPRPIPHSHSRSRSHYRTLGLIPGETPLQDSPVIDPIFTHPDAHNPDRATAATAFYNTTPPPSTSALPRSTNPWPDSPTPPPSPRRTTSSRICPICQDPIPSARVSCARCEASFHASCLREWVTRSRTCPMCRGWFSLRAVKGGRGVRVLEVLDEEREEESEESEEREEARRGGRRGPQRRRSRRRGGREVGL